MCQVFVEASTRLSIERTVVRFRMLQPLCGLTVLDTVALLVANAKQIANIHLKVTILYRQISARRQDFGALL